MNQQCLGLKKESTLISPTMTELTGPIFNKKLIRKLDNDLTKTFLRTEKSNRTGNFFTWIC